MLRTENIIFTLLKLALYVPKRDVHNQANFFPGEDFHESIKDPFVFKDETVGCRQSKKTKVVKLPPFVPPRCTFTASGNVQKPR